MKDENGIFPAALEQYRTALSVLIPVLQGIHCLYYFCCLLLSTIACLGIADASIVSRLMGNTARHVLSTKTRLLKGGQPNPGLTQNLKQFSQSSFVNLNFKKNSCVDRLKFSRVKFKGRGRIEIQKLKPALRNVSTCPRNNSVVNL